MNIEKHKVYIGTVLFLFVSLLLLILLNPINTNAESFVNGWVSQWCNDSNFSSCASYSGGWFTFNISVNKNSSAVKDIYIGGVSFNTGSYYQVRFPFKMEVYNDHLTDSNYFHYSTNGLGDETILTLYEQGYSIQFRLYNGTTATICRVESFSTTNNLASGSLVCPLVANANNITRLRVLLDNIESIVNPSTNGFGISLYLGGDFTYSISDSNAIVNSQNATTNALQDSSTNTNTENSNAISGLENNIGTNGTIQSLAVMPITLFQSMLNSINGSCTPFYIGNLFGEEVYFSCVDLSSYLGSTLWGLIDVLCCGMFIWVMSNKLRKVWDSFTNLKHKDEVGDL